MSDWVVDSEGLAIIPQPRPVGGSELEIEASRARLDETVARVLSPANIARMMAQSKCELAARRATRVAARDAFLEQRREEREARQEWARIERDGWQQQMESLSAVSNWGEMAAHCQEYEPGAIRCCFSPAVLLTQAECKTLFPRDGRFARIAYSCPEWGYRRVLETVRWEDGGREQARQEWFARKPVWCDEF